MSDLYRRDLAHIQAAAFGDLARGAAPAIIARLKNAAIEVRRVIDAGCGAGPLTEALAAGGFEVTGIDQSAELLALARAAVPAARFIQGSLYDVDLPPCEAVIALGEPLTYHDPATDANAMLRRFFARVAGAIPAGGLFIFDVIVTGEPSLTRRFRTSHDDWSIVADTVEDPASRTLVRTIETSVKDRQSGEVHHVRVFHSNELHFWLKECGFAVETSHSYGSQPLAPRRRAFFATRL